jgi:benzodiazapine receptor
MVSKTSRTPALSRRGSAYGLFIALLCCFGTSAVGGLLTSTSVSTWYLQLVRPSWNPPGWLFAPVWTTLYAMMAVSVWLVWRASDNSKRAITVFAIQLFLNLLWSALFFGLRSPGFAFVEILFLVLMIVVTIREFSRIDKLAAALLVPYVLWTSFATVLNGTIFWLNRT